MIPIIIPVAHSEYNIRGPHRIHSDNRQYLNNSIFFFIFTKNSLQIKKKKTLFVYNITAVYFIHYISQLYNKNK